MDINSEKTRKMLKDFFMFFSKNNIKIVRLDAVGYIIKKLGTSCFLWNLKYMISLTGLEA